MCNSDKLFAKVPLGWKKNFSQGVKKPHNLRNCNERCKNVLCDNCDKTI